VSVTRGAAALQIHVRDDGIGLRPGWDFERDAGVGLKNVAARLEHLYGRPGLLRLVPRDSGGLDVQIEVPDGSAPIRPNTGDRAERP
jgi:LytS/YehU family sensor histidine kinase